MTFVMSSTTPRGTKLSPHKIPMEELKKYASEGKTIAEIAKFKDTWEPELRKIISKNDKELLEKLKDNQQSRYKANQVKPKPFPKKNPNLYLSRLPMADYYKKTLSLYRSAIICAECQLIIAHMGLSGEGTDLEIPETLSRCCKCDMPTELIEVSSEQYFKLTQFKINHIRTEIEENAE